MSLRTPAWSIKRHACVPHSKEPVAKEQIYDCRHILHEHYDYGNRVNSMRKLDGGRTVVKRVHQQRKKKQTKILPQSTYYPICGSEALLPQSPFKSFLQPRAHRVY